jgi:type II secretory pathway component PulF
VPYYFYEALDTHGKKRGYTLEATSLSEAKERLRQERIFVISIKQREKKGRKTPALNAPQLIGFTSLFAAL